MGEELQGDLKAAKDYKDKDYKPTMERSKSLNPEDIEERLSKLENIAEQHEVMHKQNGNDHVQINKRINKLWRVRG